MSIDISKLRSRLDSLQNPKGAGKSDLPKTLWSPKVGKHSVRIVPSAYDKANPFKEMYFHYEFGKTMSSLINYGEKDPIVEFANGLKKTPDWKLGNKLQPKMRIYVPVIVRGEEEKGVLLWGFGKQIYMELLSLLQDEDVGDFTDPVQGRDITIETLDKATTGKDYNTSSIRVRTKQTPLSEDANQVRDWLTNQPNPLDQFKKVPYEEMKEALLKYLNPEEEEVIVKPTTPEDERKADDFVAELQAAVPQNKYTLSTSKPDLNSKIDDLFGDL